MHTTHFQFTPSLAHTYSIFNKKKKKTAKDNKQVISEDARTFVPHRVERALLHGRDMDQVLLLHLVERGRLVLALILAAFGHL